MLTFLRFFPAHSGRQLTVWLLLLLTGLPWLAQAQCPNNLTTQAQVDAFPPGCINLPSLLVIEGANITNLNSLSVIQTAGGLQITSNPLLGSLRGLDNLTSVRNGIVIQSNAVLTSLQGLNQLASAGGLDLRNNPRLTSLNGLENLKTVSNAVRILSHAELISLQGLNQLQSAGGIDLRDNPKLVNLSGLEKLSTVAVQVLIQSNSALISLQGLNQLASAGGLDLRNNPRLTNLSGLENLRTINNLVIIQGHAELISLEPLRLNQAQNLDFQGNPKLSYCANPSICSLLAQGVSATIRNNAPGCNSVQDIQADCSPLAITTQPPAQSAVCVGGTVTVPVTTSGNARAYQWYKGNQAVAGQTTGTLSLSNVQPTDAGTYRVVVSNSVSSLTSTAFSLTVTAQSPDYQPLADLYNSTDGPNWKRKNNWLTGCSPCDWDGVTCNGSGRVTAVNLRSNSLRGPIPASLSDLTYLQTLDLQRNSLSGPIPASLGNLTNLQQLILSDNELSGSIPASLGNLTNLRILLLDYSGLSGSIPDSFSALTNLQQLNLYNIRLSGSIPASFSALTNLQSLDLSSNYLSGPIPAGLGNLTKLNTLKLNDNNLSGCFPASLSALCGKEVDFSGNSDLPGRGNFAAFCTNGAGSTAFRPQATATPNPVCAGNPVSLGVSAGTSYMWSGPANFTANTQSPTFTPTSATSSGLYSVTVGSGGSTCQVTATTSVSLTVSPLPVVSITGLGSAYCKDAPAVPLTGTPAGGRFAVNGTPANQFSPAALSPGSYAIVYSFTNSSSCSATTSQTVTINALPVVSIAGLGSAYCQDAPALTLTGTPAGGSFTVDGTPTTQFNPGSLAVGNRTVNYRYTDTNGCSNTATQSVTIKATPPAPTLLTQSGGTYPASQSAVTVDINSGNVNLVVGGCMGSISWSGPNNAAGTSATIMVATTQPGTFVYRANCQVDGCTSPLATASVTVVGRLTVLHRDVDNYVDNNAIQPLIVLQNQGLGTLPLANITLRYYLTVEGAAALSNLSINYAQLGNQNVRLRYVPLQPVQQGAAGYVEYSFTAGAGSLAPNGSTGLIQAYFAKSDYSGLNERDDYSYAAVRDQLVSTLRITAYYNGALIAGIEPGSATQIQALRALTESKNGASATQISTFLEVRNEGNVPVNYSDLKARYYFTADGTERLQVEVDEGNVRAQLVKLTQAVAGADYYLEISYLQAGQLAPGASAGLVRYRILKPDGGRFNQANDYSYQEQPAERSANSRVPVYIAGERVWGTEPSGSARLAAAEPGSQLTVTVLGNPVTGTTIDLNIRGAEGQPLHLQLTDITGRPVSERSVERAGGVERQQLSIGQQPAGILLLRVSTPNQSQTVKLIIAN